MFVRLETNQGELVTLLEIEWKSAPLVIVLRQRVFSLFGPGDWATIPHVYREAEGVYVVK